MELTVSLIRNNRIQAIRIPKELELPGESTTISRQADGSLLNCPTDELVSFLRRCDPLPEEEGMPEIEDLPPEPVEL